MSAPVAETPVTITEAEQPKAEKESASSLAALLRVISAAGEGARYLREENHLSPLAAAKLRYRAIRNGWIKATPDMLWPLEARLSDFKGYAAEQPLSAFDQLAFEVYCDITSEDTQIRALAAKSCVQMMAQNQSVGHRQDRERLLQKHGLPRATELPE